MSSGGDAGRAHLDRLVAAMADAGLDALLLGAEDTVRWASGARRLWLAGTRPFTPAAVVVRATGELHLLATSDAGLPDFLDVDHVFGPTWNPFTLATRIAAVPGLAGARTIGTDGTDPAVEVLLGGFLPRATFVAGDTTVRAARRGTEAADRAAITAAVDVAQRCLASAVGAVAAGVSERDLAAAFVARAGRLGVAVPAFTPATRVAGTAPRAFPGPRRLAPGDLVNLRGGVLVDGRLGVVARTRAVGGASPEQERLAEAALEALRLTTAACRPGRDLRSLRARPDVHTIDGVGAGFDAVGDHEPLRVDDVLWIEVFAAGVLLGDVVHVGSDATTPLTTVPYGLG